MNINTEVSNTYKELKSGTPFVFINSHVRSNKKGMFMRLTIKKVFMFAYILALAIVFVATAASADDVYNFYFQKAPGPQTVIQGGGNPSTASTPNVVVQGGASTPSGATNEGQTSAPAAIAAATSVAERKKWELSVGWASTYTEWVGRFDGYGISGYYNLSKYFGLGLALAHTNTSDRKVFHSEDKRNRAFPLDVAFQAHVTPIHINVFGHDTFELGMIGGVMSFDTPEGTRGFTPFLGPKFAINLTDDFAVSIETRHHNEAGQVRMASVGARWKF